MKKRFMYLVITLVVTTHILAQSPVLQIASPASAKASAERLMRIDKIIQQYMDSARITGAAGLIAKDGKIVYNKAFNKNNPSIKTDAIFRIASQTKAITSVAVMMLFEEGRFLLDDEVSKYLPEFANPQVVDKFNESDTTYTTVPAKREITIRDLLTHMAGFSYPNSGSAAINAIYVKAGIPSGFVADKLLLADKMKQLAKLPLNHTPGQSFTYGLSIDVLGYLVEIISGMSLDRFFHQRIFEPLGMKDTYFYVPASKQNRMVPLYTEDQQHHPVPWSYKGEKYEIDYNYPTVNGTYYSGGGGLSSTLKDYAIFLQMLLNGGEYNGHRILAERTVEIMTANQIGDHTVGWNNKFGLGFEIVTAKGQTRLGTSEGSYLWGGYFGTSYWVDPKKHLIGLLYLQQLPLSHGEIHDKFKVLVYQALDD